MQKTQEKKTIKPKTESLLSAILNLVLWTVPHQQQQQQQQSFSLPNPAKFSSSLSLQKQGMEDPNSEDHERWTTEFWLLLALISNANGANLAFNRVETFPWSWFMTVIHIIFYRLLFISEPMTITVDLGFSLLLQCVSSFGDFGWKLACSIPILSLVVIIISVYLDPLFKEYKKLKELKPDSKPPLDKLVHPLSPFSFMFAFWQTFFLNGFFLIFAWFYPSNEGLYGTFQNIVGISLVIESMIFLSCYKQIKAKRDEPTQGSNGNTGISGRKARRERKKLREKSA